MEKSRGGYKTRQEHDDGYFGRVDTMTTSAGLSDSRLGWRYTSSQQDSSLGTQPTSPSTMRSRTADTPSPRRRRRRRMGSFGRMGYLLVLIASLWILPTSAVQIEFDNCLSDARKNDVPKFIQIVPEFVDAVFNTTDPAHNLKVRVWINVDGTYNPAMEVPPPANDTEYWGSNRTDLGGKILDVPFRDSLNPKRTTLFNKVNVLTYEPWAQSTGWCAQLKNGTCPLGPRFNVNE
jgi:hypothetical protein